MSAIAPLLVIIPAWNEEATIGAVVAQVKEKLPHSDIVVVADGCSDDTVKLAQESGATVLDLPLNLGVGGAMRAGFRYALRRGYTHVVQIDADGQHDPAQVIELISAMEEHRADIIIGSRFAGGCTDYAARGPRRWAMRLLAWVLSHTCRAQLSDATSGFKLLGPKALKIFASEYPAEYLGDTVEALVIAAKNGLKVRETKVQMSVRIGGVPSHGPLKSTVQLLRTFMALTIALTRKNAN